MKTLSVNQVLILQKQLIAQSGGSFGIRDEGLLDSAIKSPLQSYGGEDLYPTTIEKCVRLGYNLIKNHPFIDGNKRIGAHVMLVSLYINNMNLSYTDEDFINVVLDVAAGTKDYEGLLAWTQEHII